MYQVMLYILVVVVYFCIKLICITYSIPPLFRTCSCDMSKWGVFILGVDVYHKAHIGTFQSVHNTRASIFQGGGLEGLHCK